MSDFLKEDEEVAIPSLRTSIRNMKIDFLYCKLVAEKTEVVIDQSTGEILRCKHCGARSFSGHRHNDEVCKLIQINEIIES